jgi:acyl transferase domain-containing protein
MSGPSGTDLRALLRTALLEIRGLKAENEKLRAQAVSPIAITGMACRFPGGADSLEAFWSLLTRGVDAVSEIPPDRWDADAWFDPDPARPGRMNSRWGGFIGGVDRFDAGFFGLTPREAASTDPQHRLFLETAWEALEDAGLTADGLRGSRTGVFVGVMGHDYYLRQLASPDMYTALGNGMSFAGARLAHFLDLHGPAVPVDTACSSSLVALHLACASLRNGECDTAVVGGVNLILAPETSVVVAKTYALSSDGRCRSFDSRATGFVRGEGCGVIVLRRLEDAEVAGDRVRAVVRGSAINQDGRSAGITAPNGLAQEQVLSRALAVAGVEAAEIGLVETHGSGTPLGDAIEIEALKSVYGGAGALPCALGAVKTNLGHLEGAAGIAGVIKTVLAIEHGIVPPNLHFREINPQTSLDGSRLVIPVECVPWLGSRRAGVSSFGFSGTNAHVIVEQAPAVLGVSAAVDEDHALVVSARSEAALRALADRHAAALEGGQVSSVADWCYTAASRRTAHRHRLAVVGRSAQELASGLREGQAKASASSPEVVFVFAGQGSQWVGMGRELVAKERVFAEALGECDAAIREEAGWSVLEVVQSGAGLDRIEIVQPVLFALQVALAAQWRSWGVVPSAVVGHSMGEVAAAVVCGALSLGCGVEVICRRSRLMSRLSGRGAMALVELDLVSAQGLAAVKQGVEVAASNGPRLTVLSGEARAIGSVVEELDRAGTFARLVPVEVASHSAQVDPILGDVKAALSGLAGSSRPSLAMWSTVTGEEVRAGDLDASYWVRNLRQPVLLAPVMERLAGQGGRIFVEVGPHPVLVPGLQATLGDRGLAVGSLRREEGERAGLLRAASAIWAAGGAVDWQAVQGRRQVVSLPAYPWQHERYWLDATTNAYEIRSDDHPLLGRAVEWAGEPGRQGWENTLRLERLSYLRDHRVGGAVLLPAAAYLEMALAAAGPGPVTLRDVRFLAPLFLAEGAGQRVQLLRGADGAFSIHGHTGRTDAPWTLLAQGRIEPGGTADLVKPPRVIDGTDVSADSFYRILAGRGIEFGPAFRCLKKIRRGGAASTARLSLADGSERYRIHPVALDFCFQTLAAGLDAEATLEGTFLPVSIDRLTLVGDAGAGDSGAARQRAGTDSSIVGDCWLLDRANIPMLSIEGLRLSAAELDADIGQCLFEKRWVPAGMPLGEEAVPWRVYRADGTPGEDQCAAFLAMIQKAAAEPHCRIALVTRDAETNPDQALLWGLGRVLANEHPELRPLLIDLAPGVSDASLAALLQRPPASSGQIMLSLDGILTPRLERLATPHGGATMPIRSDASYLITGGLGGAGLTTARRLVTRGARTVILVGRRAPEAKAQAEIATLEAEGARIVLNQADISDATQLQALLDDVDRALPPLAGVVHAAAVLDDGLLLLQTPERLNKVIAGKARGAWLLDCALAGRGLDWLVFYSSLSAEFGMTGQAGYAAANSFLDALARRRRAAGGVALSIGWGPWRGVGLAANEETERLLARVGLVGLDPERCLDALERALAGGAAHVVVADLRPARLAATLPLLGNSNLLDGLLAPPAGNAAEPADGSVGAIRAADARERPALLECYFQSRLGKVFGKAPDSVPLDQPLNRMGLDSLMALELRNVVARELAVAIPVVRLLRGPTLAEMARDLAGDAAFEPARTVEVAAQDVRETTWTLRL